MSTSHHQKIKKINTSWWTNRTLNPSNTIIYYIILILWEIQISYKQTIIVIHYRDKIHHLLQTSNQFNRFIFHPLATLLRTWTLVFQDLWTLSNFENCILRRTTSLFLMNDVLADTEFLQTFLNKYFENHSTKVCLCSMKYTIEYSSIYHFFFQYTLRRDNPIIHQMVNGKLESMSFEN